MAQMAAADAALNFPRREPCDMEVCGSRAVKCSGAPTDRLTETNLPCVVQGMSQLMFALAACAATVGALGAQPAEPARP